MEQLLNLKIERVEYIWVIWLKDDIEFDWISVPYNISNYIGYWILVMTIV